MSKRRVGMLGAIVRTGVTSLHGLSTMRGFLGQGRRAPGAKLEKTTALPLRPICSSEGANVLLLVGSKHESSK